MADCAGLENRRGESLRGFESRPLRTSGLPGIDQLDSGLLEVPRIPRRERSAVGQADGGDLGIGSAHSPTNSLTPGGDQRVPSCAFFIETESSRSESFLKQYSKIG